MEEILLSYEGLTKLERELETLRTVKRREIAERIKIARDFGDLSENSEYDDAKNEQAFVESRILRLEALLRKARIVTEEEVDPDRIHIGSTVKIKDVHSGEEFEYFIVGSQEADPARGRISYESPVGRALFDRAVGDNVTVNTPAGVFEYEIVHITR